MSVCSSTRLPIILSIADITTFPIYPSIYHYPLDLFVYYPPIHIFISPSVLSVYANVGVIPLCARCRTTRTESQSSTHWRSCRARPPCAEPGSAGTCCGLATLASGTSVTLSFLIQSQFNHPVLEATLCLKISSKSLFVLNMGTDQRHLMSTAVLVPENGPFVWALKVTRLLARLTARKMQYLQPLCRIASFARRTTYVDLESCLA